MMGTQTIFAVGPILYRKTVTLDPAKDFAGVTLTGASPLVLVANPAFPAHTVADVIAMAKANPGKINFGTGGVGTTPRREIFWKGLNAAVRDALASVDTRARLAQLGMSNNSSSPEEFDAYIKSEIARWGQVIKDAQIEAAN